MRIHLVELLISRVERSEQESVRELERKWQVIAIHFVAEATLCGRPRELFPSWLSQPTDRRSYRL